MVNGDISPEIYQYIKIEEIMKAIDVLKDRIKSAKKIFKEKQFLLQDNYNKLVKNTDNNTKVMVQGVIDLVIIDDDGVSIIDFKTNNVTNDDSLIEKYRLQLQIYSIAFEKATKLKVNNKFLYSFKMGKLIKVD
jgi:ATP-dependent helicase/nuclease subunit A